MEAGRLEEGDSLLPVKYTDELKARAVELVIHAQADPDTANGAITRVANELGLTSSTIIATSSASHQSCAPYPGRRHGLL
jgi:C1A family cysteine protease